MSQKPMQQVEPNLLVAQDGSLVVLDMEAEILTEMVAPEVAATMVVDNLIFNRMVLAVEEARI